MRVDRVGGPEVLASAVIELPAPGPGEVRVRHTAIGVNYIDTYHRSGLYPLPLPFVPGSEAAGVVDALGEGVEALRVGDRVGYCAAGVGAYAEARNVAASRLVPLPDAITDEVAAATMLKGMTAEYLIRRTYAVKPGDEVLWHAAAGGVGLIATQWLAHLGAVVLGTVGTDEKAALARAHGCAHTIVYAREDFVARCRALTEGRGVAVAYDAVGRDTLLRSLECLRPRGLLVSFGNASGKPPPLDLLELSTRGSLYVTRPTLHTYVASRAELLAAAAALFSVLERGTVKAEVRWRFPLAAAADAHRALESRQTTGSIVLTP